MSSAALSVLAILQARVSSTRLPGKVLKPLLGEPMLFRQVERIQRSGLIDKLVVATSSDPTDDEIDSECRTRGLACFRGSLDDVLGRFYQAASAYKPEHVVRLTGDCPLADPELIDRIIEFHINGGYDYSSNTLAPTFPDGLDVEVCRFCCLEQAWQEASLPSQREHVTPFIHQQPLRFYLGSYVNDRDLSYLRWTVDELDDFEVVTTIYEKLYPGNPDFTTKEILSFFDNNPEISTRNLHHMRNVGYVNSLARERGI